MKLCSEMPDKGKQVGQVWTCPKCGVSARWTGQKWEWL